MSLILNIKVVPNSSKNYFKFEESFLKVYLNSSPEKGKANKELIELLSKALNIPKYKIEIISGFTTRNKKIILSSDINLEEVLKRLGI